MTEPRTHKDRDWCVLPENHEGECLDSVTKKVRDDHEILQNFRGRRYVACCAVARLTGVIENLGHEDGSQLPPCRHPSERTTETYFNPRPSEALLKALKAQARGLLDLLLLYNDGNVTPFVQKVRPEYEDLAKSLYEKHSANDPVVHCNRFPSWAELPEDQKNEWRYKAQCV